MMHTAKEICREYRNKARTMLMNREIRMTYSLSLINSLIFINDIAQTAFCLDKIEQTDIFQLFAQAVDIDR